MFSYAQICIIIKRISFRQRLYLEKESGRAVDPRMVAVKLKTTKLKMLRTMAMMSLKMETKQVKSCSGTMVVLFKLRTVLSQGRSRSERKVSCCQAKGDGRQQQKGR